VVLGQGFENEEKRGKELGEEYAEQERRSDGIGGDE
jgi:hypothetical protein